MAEDYLVSKLLVSFDTPMIVTFGSTFLDHQPSTLLNYQTHNLLSWDDINDDISIVEPFLRGIVFKRSVGNILPDKLAHNFSRSLSLVHSSTLEYKCSEGCSDEPPMSASPFIFDLKFIEKSVLSPDIVCNSRRSFARRS